MIKNFIFIFFIILIFVLVFFVFYTEYNKNKNINIVKSNFYIIKEIFNEDIKKCKDKKQFWIFGDACKNLPEINNINNYFNKDSNYTNPYFDEFGVNKNPGSVFIKIKDNKIILSVDSDANGGIDIKHIFLVN